MTSRNTPSVVALGILHAAILVTIIAAGFGGLHLIDLVRGYVAGEAAYSRAEKGAVIALHRYARSRDSTDFADYARLIQTPINYRRAREILEDPSRPIEASYPFIMAAGDHHPSAVPGLAWLFRTFGDTSLFAPPIEIWREGDRKVGSLHEVAVELERLIRSGSGSESAITALLARIDQLDRELGVLQATFSERMGDAARKLALILYTGIGGLGAGLALLGGGFALRTTRRVAAAEGRLWAFLDGSPDAISLKDTNGRYLLFNRAFEALSGIARERICGRTDAEALPGHPDMVAAIRRHDRLVLETRAPVHQEREEIGGDNRVSMRSITKFPILDASGQITAIGTINQDVTELKAAELKLRQAMRMQAVGQLTGGVAHDFNNLLSVVLGNLELLRERLEHDPSLAGMAERAICAAERGATITRRLLAFSRQQPLQPQPVDVGRQLDAMSELFGRTIDETIEVTVISRPGAWRCFADPAELEAALLNLAINARDAMPEGGKLTFEVSNVEVEEGGLAPDEGITAGDYVLVAVSDTGCGMSSETIERAFEPFFTTKPTDKGSGLGLSMVHGFARQSGGHARIYSEPGHGTTVKLWLPRARDAEETEDRGEADRAEVPGGAERILIAEDNDLVREHVISQLESLGYRVAAVRNGPEAIAALRESADVDLLLTDVVMPGGMSGFELADEARRLRPKLPVLFTSGYTEGAVMQRGQLEAGMTLLQKPYRRQEIATKIRVALDQRSGP